MDLDIFRKYLGIFYKYLDVQLGAIGQHEKEFGNAQIQKIRAELAELAFKLGKNRIYHTEEVCASCNLAWSIFVKNVEELFEGGCGDENSS